MAFVERLCFVYRESLGADVLGMPVIVPRSSEGSVGMAILARAGSGPVAETATRMSRTRWEFEPGNPNDRLAEHFERLTEAFVGRGFIPEDLARRARMER